MSNAGLLYFEDIEIGRSFPLGERTVAKEEMIAFSKAFDPQAFHLDEAAGEASPLGGLCASGWHTCALVHRMNCDAFMNKVAALGSPGGDELRWLKPLFPGDTIYAVSTIAEKRESASRPNIGLVHLATEAQNQKGEKLFRLRAWVMVARRPHS